jgi:hypothetical protein
MNMTTFDFGYGPVPAHQHSHGGGWVADTAKVAGTAYVGPDAQVYGDARASQEDMFIEMSGKRYKLVEVE